MMVGLWTSHDQLNIYSIGNKSDNIQIVEANSLKPNGNDRHLYNPDITKILPYNIAN